MKKSPILLLYLWGLILLLPYGLRAGPPSYEADSLLYSSRRNAIVRAAQKVGPAVVSISVTQIRVYRRSPFLFSDPFIDQFFPELRREYRQRIKSMGSGFIIDKEGHILTNEHMVEDATQIVVNLPDGRQFPGKIQGSDPITDLAVLKIEAKDLPVAPLGDSDDMIIGEWAIAIGNPFGFLISDSKPTVTVGVISAVNRDFEPRGGHVYQGMIQTDAAINPGNSGGPLVNAVGEVIGINTFIFTESGGSLGIGFAIPINTAKKVIRELLRYGRVRQIWTGLRVQRVDRLIAQSLGLPQAEGVIISHIDQRSPGEKAGLKVGDVITEVDGHLVRDEKEIREVFYTAQVGDEFKLNVWREGKTLEKRLKVELMPEERR